ncbi:hypothetical protein Zmor_003493 [Zophobas morio]|uniref:DUF4773 domain-containing protein n=1 Tax=Zophobas morio TaxID=2755281 RepID=A0AA38M2N6_9CUCU|nr:hypothetical protein Zmor_003493 [Zophobas morio]
MRCPFQRFKNALTVFVIFHSSSYVLEAATLAQNCECERLTCTCCVNFNSARACVAATYVPADLALYVNILANGDSVYATKIDSGNFPICAPVFPPACWAFNRIHIDKDNVQVCSEVRIGPVPILKVPCLAYAGGNLIASPNNY